MYGVYRYIDHVALSGSDTDTYRLELQKKDFAGSSVEWDGSAEKGVFKHVWDNIDPENLWDKGLQKSELEIYPLIKSSGDFSILEEIFSANEDEFRIVKKINGTQVWTGKVLPGLLSYPESNFIYPANIVAKDSSHLEGEDFTLEDNRETIITTLARLLPYDLPIHSYTSWTNISITESGDFLNQIYHDTIVFRTVDNSSSLSAEPWSKYRVIEEICKAGRLIIRQDDGVWNIIQLSELSNAGTARRFVYDSSGVLQSSGTVDLTKDIDQDVLSIYESSINEHKEAIKQNRVIFNHQSGSSEVEFPIIPENQPSSGAVDTISDGFYLKSQPFAGNGDEKLHFTGRVLVQTQDIEDLFYFYSINIGDYFLLNDFTWTNDLQDIYYGTLSSLSTYLNTTTGEFTRVFDGAERERWIEGAPVRLFANMALPSGLDSNTTYYLKDLADDVSGDVKFKLSKSPGGSAVVPSDTGGGGFVQFHLIANLVEFYKSSSLAGSGLVQFVSSEIPDGADGDLEVYLPAFSNPYNDVKWFSVSSFIENPTQAGEEIEYRLTQSGAFSLIEGKDSTPEIYFGDGPFTYSRSSYRYGNSLNLITPSWWKRVGDSNQERGHAKHWLEEELDLRRTARRCLQADLHGTYRTNKVIKHENTFFFFLGGTQTGYDNNFSAELFELNLETDG